MLLTFNRNGQIYQSSDHVIDIQIETGQIYQCIKQQVLMSFNISPSTPSPSRRSLSASAPLRCVIAAGSVRSSVASACLNLCNAVELLQMRRRLFPPPLPPPTLTSLTTPQRRHSVSLFLLALLLRVTQRPCWFFPPGWR